MIDDERKLISTNDLCEKLGLSPMTIFRLRGKGLPTMKIGGSIRFDESKVMEWIKNRAGENGESTT